MFAASSDYIGPTEQGGFRLPPGLRLPLYRYLRRPWLNFGDPIPLFEHLQTTFGPIAHYRFLGMLIVFVNDPQMIGEILINQAPSFVKERTLQRMKILLGEGLITSDDPIHMRQRKLIAPAFHRARIAGYAAEIVRSAQQQIAQSAWQDGAVLDISDQMMRLSLRIVARTLFATEVTPDVLSVVDEVNKIMRLYNFLVVAPGIEHILHLPLPGINTFRRARERLNAIVGRMIASRRSLAREDLLARGDLLSVLVAARYENDDDTQAITGMDDTQIRDEALTIFLAGYETVANALTWTWYLLSQNPDAANRMYAEVDTALENRTATLDDLPNLRYTEMVLAESMRLYPPAWAMGRKSTAPVQLGPYRIPAGANFFFSQYILQRSDAWWDSPLAFRPERHTPENKATRTRFTYFPFGAGRRQCIGESFAWTEGILSLATIAQHWRLELMPGQTVVPQAKITIRPKDPLQMRLIARSAAATTRLEHFSHRSGAEPPGS